MCRNDSRRTVGSGGPLDGRTYSEISGRTRFCVLPRDASQRLSTVSTGRSEQPRYLSGRNQVRI